MSDSGDRLEKLHFARRVAEQLLIQIDHWIEQEQRRTAERRRGEQARPPAPDWVLEIGAGRRNRPTYVHTGDCHLIGKHHRGVDRTEALRALATGVDACPHCRPDGALGFLE